MAKLRQQSCDKHPKNPPGSIDRLLDKINSGIHNIQDLINFIPDSPFPARGLIQALCQLIEIGTVCILVDRTAIARTPGRAVLKGRSALQENAIRGGAMTVNVKGKKTASQSFQPITLRKSLSTLLLD